jgi:hypothetical protein
MNAPSKYGQMSLNQSTTLRTDQTGKTMHFDIYSIMDNTQYKGNYLELEDTE